VYCGSQVCSDTVPFGCMQTDMSFPFVLIEEKTVPFLLSPSESCTNDSESCTNDSTTAISGSYFDWRIFSHLSPASSNFRNT
jgi:hypothetical protein